MGAICGNCSSDFSCYDGATWPVGWCALCKLEEVLVENRRLRLLCGEIEKTPTEDWEAVKRGLGIDDEPGGSPTKPDQTRRGNP